MSKQRIDKRAGFVNPSQLPKGPSGRALCRYCNQEVPKGRRSFCSDECIHQHKILTNPGYVRDLIYERDKGICSDCGLDTDKAKKRIYDALKSETIHFSVMKDSWYFHKWLGIPANRTSIWDADHIKPVAQGGGGCGLDNYQTLCIWCHKKKTKQQRKLNNKGAIHD
jgi:5-methylcytosine-specific restriction endonuclease McrA